MNRKTYQSLWNGQLAHIVEIIFDLAIIFGSVILYSLISHFILEGIFPNVITQITLSISSIASYSTYLIVCIIFFIVYKPSIINRTYLSSLKSIVLTLLMANFLLVFLEFVFKSEVVFSPLEIIFVFLIQVVLFLIAKFFGRMIVKKFNIQSVIIIGPKDEAIEFAERFLYDSSHNQILKYVIYYNGESILNHVKDYIIDVNNVYLTAGIDDAHKNEIIQYAIAIRSKDVFIVPKTVELNLVNSKQDNIDDRLVLHIPTMHLTLEQRFFKRAFDIIVSGTGLILASPIMFLIMILIKIEDRGPAIYKQERYKRKNQPFMLYKFRSMRVKQSKDEMNKLASKNDSRITKIGKFIRASRIDELPQLFNVLKGDMSLVGPRPYMKFVIDEAMRQNQEFVFRTNVKPGITGLAHAMGRYDTDAIERLRFDLFYVKNYSFFLDLKIIILTIKTMLNKEAGLGKGENLTIYEMAQILKFKIEEFEYGLLFITKTTKEGEYDDSTI